MKNIRLKIVLLSTTLTLIIILCLWRKNSYHLDIARTKNEYLENKTLNDVMNSTDIEFIKKRYVKLLNVKRKIKTEQDNIVGETMRYLTIVAFILLLNLIMLFRECSPLLKNSKNE